MTVHNYRLYQKVTAGQAHDYEIELREGAHAVESFNDEPDSQYKRCLSLWASVIDNQVREAHGIISGGRDANTKAALERQAHAWMTSDREDFPLVCELAGIEPHATRKAFREGVLTPETLLSGERYRNGGQGHG